MRESNNEKPHTTFQLVQFWFNSNTVIFIALFKLARRHFHAGSHQTVAPDRRFPFVEKRRHSTNLAQRRLGFVVNFDKFAEPQNRMFRFIELDHVVVIAGAPRNERVQITH